MANAKLAKPEAIAKDEFSALLGQYPALIEAISVAKGATKGQRTLQQLDQFRYVDALETLGGDKPLRSMSLDDVKTLVEWKLRHGKFRPTLMKLITSNDPVLAKETIQDAITTYHSALDAPSALAILTKLKGVGPATASLLLSVHDPTRVIFFSDEAFLWLCCGGKKSPIKYNAKEYEALRSEANDLVERLGVSATDVEKVAYVLMKRPDEAAESKGSSGTKTVKATASVAPSAKRKTGPSEIAAQAETTVRRSKRTKA